MEEIVLTGNVNLADIPTTIKTEFASVPTSLSDIQNRLDQGGKCTLKDAVLEIGEIDLQNDLKLFLGLNQLELENSTIITNGNFLEVFCNSIGMDSRSKIISFDQGNRRAQVEEDGDYGGDVHVYVLDQITSALNIALDGQNGGIGRDGGKGSTGKRGRRGKKALNGSFGTCRRGQGKGKRGKTGGRGKPGTDGGDGGDGGFLKVFFLEKDIQPNLIINLSMKEGIGGTPGKGGPGGEGGPGGKPGKPAGNCSKRRRIGDKGKKGPRGKDGAKGENGVEGKAVIERIEVNELGNS